MLKKDLALIKEGSAKFYIYNIDQGMIPSKSMNVFYNKNMELNRDISSLAINAYSYLYKQKNMIFIDSMAASGVSSIRILKECKNVKTIFINDINPATSKLIKKNINLNNLNNRAIKIIITKKDANLLFSEIASKTYRYKNISQKKPNIISIDPFGTPNIYLDSAFKTIQKKKGLICITATDTAVLFGIRPYTCFRKYFAKPLHTNYCKEIGSRILLYFISRMANLNKLGIIPLLTFSSGHFIRIFCVTFKNQEKINKFFDNIGYLIHCNNCGYRNSFGNNILALPKECPLCLSKTALNYAGPLWIGKIHKSNFVQKILNLNENFEFINKKKIKKLLTFAIEENNMPVSYYNLHKLSRNFKLTSIPKIKDVISIIRNKGYQVSRTHFDYLSIKTNLDLESLKKILTDSLK